MGCLSSQNWHHTPRKEAQSPVFSWGPWRPLPEPVAQAAREKANVPLSEAQAEDVGVGGAGQGWEAEGR